MENNEMQAPTILCSQGCGFYGNPHTLNMCSKCYRDYMAKQREKDSVTTEVQTESNHTETVTTKLNFTKDETTSVELNDQDHTDKELADTKKAVRHVHKCQFCGKRVGMYGFKCKCGHMFCTNHRHSAAHNCTYNYHEEEKNFLEKTVLKVTSNKLSG